MADIDQLSIRISASARGATNQINRLTDALRNLNAELNRIDPSRLDGVTSAANNMSGAMTGLRSSLRTVSRDLGNIGNQNGQITQTATAAQNLAQAAGQITQSVNGAANATQRNVSATQQLGGALNNVSNNARNASRHLRDTGSSANTSKKSFKGLTKELTRIGKMLKLMVTRMVLRKVIQGVLDGFKNLAQYSSTFDSTLSLLWNSLRQLGNAIAAAVSPILNALAPALNYIIQLCIKVVDVINQVISALAGFSTWTKAKTLTDDYAKSLDKAKGSAKELKKTVLGFDELNQLQDNKNSGGGGGGTSPANMFEEKPIDPSILKFLDDLKAKIAALKPYWDAFVKGFLNGLGDWKSKIALITDGIARIQKALKDIWNDPDVAGARDKYFLSLASMLGTVLGTIARIGLNIGANLAQGIAAALESKTEEIKAYLVSMFDIGTEINQQIEAFALAIGRISDVLVGENAIAATQHFTELFLESFMLITENAAKLGSTLVTLVTQPIIDNESAISTALDDLMGILGGFADSVQTIIKDIRDILSDVWTNHISPMFASLTQTLSSLVAIALDTWHNSIAPIFTELKKAIDEVWKYLEPILDDIITMVGSIGNIVARVFGAIFIPLFEKVTGFWFPKLKDAISVIITWVKLLLKTWATVMENMLWWIRTLLEFFSTAFTSGWDAACEQLSQSWSQHWEDMKTKVHDILNDVIEFVEKALNAIVNGINSIADVIGQKLSNITFPSWLGGGSFSLEIPHLSQVTLPRFRNGGFPRENGLFLANSSEMLGKFSNGRTAVANNEQITNGIAQAVYSAITAANSSSGGQYINNTIMVDGDVIARVVTKGQERLNRRYSPTMA